MSRRVPKFEALVVKAIRRLRADQGSTASEIANYLHHEYDFSGPEVRRQIQLTIRRGLNYGILEKSKRGYTTCDQSVPDNLDPQDVTECFNCRKAARRSRGGMKRSRRERRVSRKSSRSRKRAGKRRAAGHSRKRGSVRRVMRSPRKHSSQTDAAKSKNAKSQEMGYGRQPSNGSNSNVDRSSSKSPSRSGDVKREQ